MKKKLLIWLKANQNFKKKTISISEAEKLITDEHKHHDHSLKKESKNTKKTVKSSKKLKKIRKK